MTAAASRAGNADALVIFGISGDLARVMTFRSLYRLERRGLLDCPILGVAVDDWSVEDLREHARAAIVATASRSTTRSSSGWPRGSPTSGDFNDEATYSEVAKRVDGAALPVFYLEIPPFLFGKVVGGLAGAGLTEERPDRRREAVRPRPRVRARPRRGAPRIRRRVADLPHRPLPREDGAPGDPLPALRECDPRATLEPQLRRERCRSRWPRASGCRRAATSTTRSARSATSSSTT